MCSMCPQASEITVRLGEHDLDATDETNLTKTYTYSVIEVKYYQYKHS